MVNALSTAISGLNAASARVANASENILNASSTSQNPSDSLAQNVVATIEGKTDFQANAAVVRVVKHMQDALLDITV